MTVALWGAPGIALLTGIGCGADRAAPAPRRAGTAQRCGTTASGRSAEIVIWLAIVLLAAIALAPLALSLRRTAAARGRQEAAVALHRAQLAELDRDLADGRIAATEHANAVLEVQRRLLAAAGGAETEPRISSRGPVLFALLLVPLGAFALYLLGGSPELPAVPLADRIAVAREREAQEAALIAQLRRRLGEIDPHSEQAHQGYILLGNAEASRGRLQEAADAWRTALAMRFDPTIAAEAAEAITEAQGRVTEEAATLFRRAGRIAGRCTVASDGTETTVRDEMRRVTRPTSMPPGTSNSSTSSAQAIADAVGQSLF